MREIKTKKKEIELLGSIEKAKLADVDKIYELMQQPVKETKMLYRPRLELARRIRDFFVCRLKNKVIGCIALRIWTKKAAEIQSLVVSLEHRGKGIARRLIEICLKDAKNLGVPFVFIFTYEGELIMKVGFEKIGLNCLPRIIFTEKFVSKDKVYGLKK